MTHKGLVLSMNTTRSSFKFFGSYKSSRIQSHSSFRNKIPKPISQLAGPCRWTQPQSSPIKCQSKNASVQANINHIEHKAAQGYNTIQTDDQGSGLNTLPFFVQADVHLTRCRKLQIVPEGQRTCVLALKCLRNQSGRTGRVMGRAVELRGRERQNWVRLMLSVCMLHYFRWFLW